MTLVMGGACPAVISVIQDPVNDIIIAFFFLANFLKAFSRGCSQLDYSDVFLRHKSYIVAMYYI